MALVRFRPFNLAVDPFRELSDVQSEMNRVFDGLFGRPAPVGGIERIWAPVADMYETEGELVVTVDLPGVSEQAIHLSITGDRLALRGERPWNPEAKPENYYRREQWVGKFERTLLLPIPVQADKVKAAYRNGVLTVTLPKAEHTKSKEIKVDVT